MFFQTQIVWIKSHKVGMRTAEEAASNESVQTNYICLDFSMKIVG